MNNHLYNESVSDEVIEREDQASTIALTVAKFGVTVLPLFFAPTSPLAAAVGIGLSETLGYAISKIGEKKQNWLVELVSQVTDKVSEPVLTEKLQSNEEYAELFQDGMKAVMDSKTHEHDRLKMIANILVDGVNKNGSLSELRKYLSVLSSLDELDLLILCSIYKKEYPFRKIVKSGEDRTSREDLYQISEIWSGRSANTLSRDSENPLLDLVELSITKLETTKLIMLNSKPIDDLDTRYEHGFFSTNVLGYHLLSFCGFDNVSEKDDWKYNDAISTP